MSRLKESFDKLKENIVWIYKNLLLGIIVLLIVCVSLTFFMLYNINNIYEGCHELGWNNQTFHLYAFGIHKKIFDSPFICNFDDPQTISAIRFGRALVFDSSEITK